MAVPSLFLGWSQVFRGSQSPGSRRKQRQLASRSRIAALVERLEERTLLDASGLLQAALLGYHGSDLAGKDGPLAKAGLELGVLYQEYLAHQSTPSTATFQTNSTLMNVRGDQVVIDVSAGSGDVNALRSDLEALGAQITGAFGPMISALLPVSAIPAAAGLNTAVTMSASLLPMTHAGSVTSQGDASMRADLARSAFNVDGTGITIGTLSDSYNTRGGAAADIASGDLPTGINVLQELVGPGSDEGRAMMQLIHDVVPGASQQFHSAFNGMASFASGIVALADAGSDVIVDDVIYFAEPMFQDGIVAQAVDTVVDRGISYFSSAGNSARQSYESAFRNSGLAGFGGVMHDFDPGAANDTFQQVTIGAGQTVTMAFQWDEAYASLGGFGSRSDIDIHLLDGPSTTAGTLVRGFDGNIGGDPVEIMSYTNTSGSAQTAYIAIVNFGSASTRGPEPGLMKYVEFRGGMTVDEYDTQSGTSYGHANAAGAASVGAAYYAETPVFGQDPPLLEPFSSAGGINILFSPTGQRLAQPEVRRTPDFTAPDGTDTTFFGFDSDANGSPNFFGTSAAAPHAAAVAGLMLQRAGGPGTLTPSDIYQALEDTAIDIGLPGYDRDSGQGLIDAFAALGALEIADDEAPTAVADVADVVSAAPVTFHTFTVTYSDNIAIRTSTLNNRDVLVTGSGGFQRFASLESVNDATDGTPRIATYRIVGPGGDFSFQDNGLYSLVMQASQVRDTSNNNVPAGLLATFNVNIGAPDTVPPTAPSIIGLTDDTGESASDQVTRDTTPIFSWTASTDAGSGVSGYWWSINNPNPQSGGTFTAGLSAAPPTLPNGAHVFYVRARDTAGNLSAVSSLSFVVDTNGPTVRSLTPTDGGSVVTGPNEILVEFSEAMDRNAGGLQTSDLTLGGPGRGSITVVEAEWVNETTARFRVSGLWSTGLVTVKMTSGLPRDRAGNSLIPFTSGSFTIGADGTDPTPPEINGLDVDTGASNADGVTNYINFDPANLGPNITWKPSTDPDSGIKGYWWAVNNPFPQSGGTFTGIRRVSLTDTDWHNVPPNQTTTFYVVAEDNAGNFSVPSAFEFRIDTIGPFGSSPQTGTIAYRPTFIDIVFNEKMDRVSADNLLPTDLTFISGAGVGTATVGSVEWVSQTTARFHIDGSFNNSGTVNWRMSSGYPRDLAGNPLGVLNGSFNITPDSIAPSAPAITGMTPDTGESSSDFLTKSTTPTFAWSASTDNLGGSGVAGYWWSLDSSNPRTTGTFTTSLSATLNVPSNGLHIFYVQAQDLNGNLSTVSSRSFTLDSVRPTVASISPPDGTRLSTGPLQITVTFSEQMDRVSANNLLTSFLTVSSLDGGNAAGFISVDNAVWLNATTARFDLSGAWQTGDVRLQLNTGAKDRAGNGVFAFESTFTVAAGDDHGNNSASATPYTLNTTALGHIETAGDPDWFSFQAVAGHSYAFEVQLGTLSDSVLRLYAPNGTSTIVTNDDISTTDQGSRIEWTAPAGGTYFLRVTAAGNQTGTYSLRMPSVVINGNTANVYGTTATDTFKFDAEDSHAVSVNGSTTVLGTGVTGVNFYGNGGNDLLRSSGNSGNDTVDVSPRILSHTGQGFAVAGTNIGKYRVFGRGGADVATLHDSAGDDRFIVKPQDAWMIGTGYFNRVLDFETVFGGAEGGGFDRAYFHDSPLNDRMTFGEFVSEMNGPAGNPFRHVASNFTRVYAYATAGGANDRADFFDTAGDDKFVGRPTYATLLTPAGYQYARRFEKVVAFSGAGGRDGAHLFGSADADTLDASPNNVKLIGPAYNNEVRHFAKVFVRTGSGGHDVANVTGSNGSDRLTAHPNWSRLIGSGFNNYIRGFDEVHVFGLAGNDTATMYDSAGDDTATVRKESLRLSGPGFSNTVHGFESVTADSFRGGTDRILRFDSQLDYVFTQLGNWI